MFTRSLIFAFALLATMSPAVHAQELTENIEAYLVNFKSDKGFTPLVNGLAFEYERLQHNWNKESQYNWAVSVAIEPSGRYAVGFGKDIPSGAGPTRHSQRFCNQARKNRAMKAKCRSFAINDKIQKPYKR